MAKTKSGGKLKLIRRKDSPYWYVTGTINGRRYNKSTQCTERWQAEEQRIRWENEELDFKIHGPSKSISFAEAITSYAQIKTDHRFLLPLLEYFGETPVNQITDGALQACAMNLYPKASPSTINRQVIGPASAVINHGQKSIDQAPRRFTRRKEPRGRLRWLTPAEAERLLHAAHESHDKELPHKIIALIGGGFRKGEFFDIDMKDVHLDSGEIFIPYEKAGDGRMVKLPQRAAIALKQIAPPSGALWRKVNGRAMSCPSNWKAFENATRRAKLHDVTPHTLRHTFATWYCAQTKDLLRCKTLGGWSRTTTLERYAKLAPTTLGEELLSYGWNFKEQDEIETPVRTIPIYQLK